MKNSARTAGVAVSADGGGLVSLAGAALLWETMRVTGLGRGLSESLVRWRAPRAVHDPGKIVADLAAAVALGGDCLADIAVPQEQPALAGPVASDPVVSRLVRSLADDAPRALKAIRAARAGRTRPHPGAQLRFTDIDGHRFTCFATDARKGQLADLELRHRRRARCEDRIRCAKDTGLRNLPLKGFTQNQVWCEIVALACELIAWTQVLALAGDVRRWGPRRLRLRLFSVAAAWPATAAG